MLSNAEKQLPQFCTTPRFQSPHATNCSGNQGVKCAIVLDHNRVTCPADAASDRLLSTFRIQAPYSPIS